MYVGENVLRRQLGELEASGAPGSRLAIGFHPPCDAGTSEMAGNCSCSAWPVPVVVRLRLLVDRPQARGLNGTYPGPTLRAERGDEIEVLVTNGVDEATTLHWYGMHLPAAMDGGPHQMVAPGETWSPSWEIDQPAA